jgi:hypothetical protein
MSSGRPPVASSEDAGEVIALAEELRAREEAAAQAPDLVAIGAELGVPERHVVRAAEELARRRGRRRAVAVAAGALVAVVAAFLGARAWSAAHRSLRGASVAFDVGRGVGSSRGDAELTDRGARVGALDGPITEAALAPLSVVLMLESRQPPLAPGELDALERFVRSGHGLVIADLGWSWVTYVKEPLDALPANQLGRRLGFAFDDQVLGPPARVEMEGVPWPLARNGWVAGGIVLRGDGPRVMIRDERLRPMAGVIDAGRGHVVVVAHAGMLVDNPALLARCVELAMGR